MGVRHLQRRHGSTGWTDRALEMAHLSKLGNFAVTVRSKKKSRTITFEDWDVAVEFLFERVPRTAVDYLEPTLQRASETRDPREQKALAGAFMQSVLSGAVLEKDISPDEVLLGTSVSLRDYWLQSVRRLVRRAGWLGPILPAKSVVLFVAPA